MNMKILARLALAAVLAAVLAVTAACGPGHGGHAAAAASSLQANPAAQADAAQAEAALRQCITGTPLQQIHTVHVVLAERASGTNGAEVTATRARVFGCLGVPASQRTAFRNASLTAAENQQPRAWTKAGIRQYLLVTWPGLLAKYRTASGATADIPGVPAVPSATAGNQA